MNKLMKTEEYMLGILTNFKEMYNKITPYVANVKYEMFNETDQIGMGGGELIQFPNGITHVKIEVTTGEKGDGNKIDEYLSMPIEYVDNLQKQVATGSVKILNVSVLQATSQADTPDLFLNIEIQRPVKSPVQQYAEHCKLNAGEVQE